ncbi:hypothetical protein Tco_1442283 [Tanacetum coccineum]
MSTLMFVNPESSTQADGAQSSRVPVPLPEDPYEAIRQAYLDEPFEDPTDTKTPESPLAIAPPVLVPILRRTAHTAARLPHKMSSGLSASMAEGSKEDDDEEDEEIEESMDSNSMSEDAKDEGPTAEDKDPAAEDKGLTTEVEGPGMDDEDYDLDDETHAVGSFGCGDDCECAFRTWDRALRHRELALEEGDVYSMFEVRQGSGSAPESERPERVSAFRQPTLTTWTYPKDGMIYIDIPDYPPLAPPVQTPPSPEWTSGLLPISPSHSDVPSPISSPMIPLTISSPVATPATVKTEGFLTDLGAQVEMQRGLIHDHAV